MSKIVGTVKVVGGMVSLIKESDLKYVTKRGTGNLLGFAIWGRDQAKTAEAMKTVGFDVKELEALSFIPFSGMKEEDYQQFYAYIQNDEIKLVSHPIHDNSYDRLFIENTAKMRIQTHREEIFYASPTYSGNGTYNVFANENTNTFHAFFGDEVHVSVDLITNLLDTIEVAEPTNYLFADPGYLNNKKTNGTIITLLPDVKYYVYQNIDAEDKIPVSLIVTERQMTA